MPRPIGGEPAKTWMTYIETLEAAFDAQSRELEIAVGFLQPDQLTEFRHRAYPTLYPR